MADDEESGSEMKDVTSTSFGYLIGFLLPGIFGLYALSTWFPSLKDYLQPLLKAEANVGPSILFLVIAIGMGLCLSAVRHFAFEKGFYKRRCISKELFKHLDQDKLALFRSFAEEHYRYHQFYGGCAVAASVLYTGWLKNNWNFSWQLVYVTAGFLLLELLLERSAADCWGKYVDRCNALDGETQTAKHKKAGGVI